MGSDAQQYGGIPGRPSRVQPGDEVVIHASGGAARRDGEVLAVRCAGDDRLNERGTPACVQPYPLRNSVAWGTSAKGGMTANEAQVNKGCRTRQLPCNFCHLPTKHPPA